MKKISFVIVLLLSGLIWSCGGDQPKKKKEDPFKTEASKKKQTSEEESTSTTVPDEEDGTEEDAVVTTPIPPEQIEKAKEILAAVSDSDLAGIDGKKKYKLFCTPCHGMDGRMAINGAKDLTKVKTSLEENVAQIYHGKGMMTPFKGVLKDAEIVAVANYVRDVLRK